MVIRPYCTIIIFTEDDYIETMQENIPIHKKYKLNYLG